MLGFVVKILISLSGFSTCPNNAHNTSRKCHKGMSQCWIKIETEYWQPIYGHIGSILDPNEYRTKLISDFL